MLKEVWSAQTISGWRKSVGGEEQEEGANEEPGMGIWGRKEAPCHCQLPLQLPHFRGVH